MLKFARGHNTIIKCFTSALNKFPTYTSHIKLYCIGIVKQKNYTSITKNKRPDTPIENEIVIYENENSKFFLKLSIISFLNYTFWSLFGISTYQLISEVREDALEVGWLADGKNRQLVKSLVIASVILGTLLVICVWLYIFRSIKTITLKKESKNVIIETFAPFYTVRRFIVPLKHVSGVMSRHKVKGYVPLKIKNKLFYFLVDVNGRFRNHSLFDSSIALKRHFNN